MNSKSVANSDERDPSLSEGNHREVASRVNQADQQMVGASPHVTQTTLKNTKSKWRAVKNTLGRHESLRTIQLIIAIVGGSLALILAAIEILDRFGRHKPNENDINSSSPITAIMAQLQVSKDDTALIEELTYRFVASFANPSRERVVEYVRLKKSAVSQVRFIVRKEAADSDSQETNLEAALRQGEIQSIESLVSEDESSGSVLADVGMLSELQLLSRAHLAIVIDNPRAARAYFEHVAARRSEADPQNARNLLADGADNLSGLGCALGKDWLDAAIGLYESSLRNWPRTEEAIEWAITQNNFGVALLSVGTAYADGENSLEVLRRSAEAFRNASSVLSAEQDGPIVNFSIVYSNLGQATSKLLAFDPDDPVLLQQQAVAWRSVVAFETQALARGGQQFLDELRENTRSMQIVSKREATEAQRLRLTGDYIPCQRPL